MKLIISFTLIYIIISIYAPIEYLIKFTSDDSYFYLKTALNLANGHGSTFDGINPTNGYHPLNTIVLYLIFKVSSLINLYSEGHLLRIIFVSTTIINFFTLYVLLKIYKHNKEINDKYYLTVIIIIPLCLFYLLGLETQLFILILSIVLLLLLNIIEKGFNSKYLVNLSIFISLLFLARIDLFWYVILSLFYFILTKKSDLVKYFLLSLVIPFIIIIFYLTINKIYFGDYFPISGKYKLSYGILDNLRFFPTPMKNPIDFMMLIMILGSGLFFFLREKEKIPVFVSSIKFIYLGTLFFLVVNIFLNQNGLREWYYVYGIFPASILLSFSVKNKIKQLFIIFAIILNVIYLIVFRTNYYNHTSAYIYANELKKVTNQNDLIYQVDYSGIVSFFSSRKIINGDGLINSKEYYNHIKNGTINLYLQKYRPKYLSFYSFNNVFYDDSINYNFTLNKEYLIKESKNNLILKSPLIYGGLFRKKYGNFFLVKINDWNIKSN